MNDTTVARLDSAWKLWSVPRVNKGTTSVRASLIGRWTAWRRPTAFQRCLAIHILNTTESVNDAAPATDAA